MDATTIRRAARVALLTLMMALPDSTSPALAQSDVSRLDALRDAVQTEVRYVEAEEFVGDRTLLAALDELRDEVGYLRVALKRGLPVSDPEYRRVEERLAVVREAVRRADANTERSAVPDALEIPIGAPLELRLRDSLTSAIEAGVAHRFFGTTLADVRAGGQVVDPRRLHRRRHGDPVDAGRAAGVGRGTARDHRARSHLRRPAAADRARGC